MYNQNQREKNDTLNAKENKCQWIDDEFMRKFPKQMYG